MVFRLIKKAGQVAKQTQTQSEIEATKPAAYKPAPKKPDFRFPAVKPSTTPPPAVPKPAFQEGGGPNYVMGEYTPISPSGDLKNQFSDYQGSLDTSSMEGTGYQAEAYDPVEVPYRTDPNAVAKVLPESFSRDTLLQAVVMAEILKRPGVRR